MSCCSEKTRSSTVTFYFPQKTYGSSTSSFTSAQMISEGVTTVYVSQPSVIQVTFSGTVSGISTVPTTTGLVGFQLSMYNVLGGIGTASVVREYPKGTLVGANSIAISTTYAWNVCAGTYALSVYLLQNELGNHSQLLAGGDLCVITSTK